MAMASIIGFGSNGNSSSEPYASSQSPSLSVVAGKHKAVVASTRRVLVIRAPDAQVFSHSE